MRTAAESTTHCDLCDRNLFALQQRFCMGKPNGDEVGNWGHAGQCH